MKYVKLLLAALVVLTSAIHLLMGYTINFAIMFMLLAILNAINGWERYKENKQDGIIFFVVAIFIGIVSIVAMFS